MKVSLSFVPKKQEYTATNGLYCAMAPISGARKIFTTVSAYLRKAGIKAEPLEDYHVTVVWSDKSPDEEVVQMMLEDSPTCKAKVSGVTSWEGHDKDGYIVLELESVDLERRHKEWLKAGASHSFEDYRAHVTLAHKLDMNKAEAVVQEMDTYFKAHPTTIVFGEEVAVDRKD